MSVPVCLFVCEILRALYVRSTHRGPCSLMVQTENTVAPSWPICLVFFLWKLWHWSCSEDWCTHKSLSKPHRPDLSGHAFSCPNLILSEYTSALTHPFRESLSLFLKQFTLGNTETSKMQYKTFCALYVNCLVNCLFFFTTVSYCSRSCPIPPNHRRFLSSQVNPILCEKLDSMVFCVSPHLPKKDHLRRCKYQPCTSRAKVVCDQS